MKSTLVLLLCSSLALSCPTSAQTTTINASGKAPIVGKKPDPNLIMNAALDDARRDVVKRLLIEAIGFESASTVGADRIEILKDEISPQSVTVVGVPAAIAGNYVVNVTASVDREWFRRVIAKYNIRTAAQRVRARETIMMMVDLTYGVSRDLGRPREVVTEFSSSRGASFSDKSMEASSEKNREGNSESYAQGSSVRGSSAAAVSGNRGSAVARGSFSGAQASRGSSASASSSSSAVIQKNNIQAEVHDDVNYRQQVSAQDATVQQGSAENAITAVKSTAEAYGLDLLPINILSSQYFGGRAPSWADLQNSSRFRPFLGFLKSNKVNFFLGGTLNITDGAPGAGGRFATCSGTLAVNIFPTGALQGLPGATATDTDSGANAQECQNNLVKKLGKLAGEQIGNNVQDYWRRQGEDAADTAIDVATANSQATQAAYALVGNGTDYTVTFNAPGGLDYSVARQISQLLPEIPGVEKVARLSLTANQVVYQIFYRAKTELDGAIMDKLIPVSALAGLKPQEVNGTKLMLCVAGCK